MVNLLPMISDGKIVDVNLVVVSDDRAHPGIDALYRGKTVVW